MSTGSFGADPGQPGQYPQGDWPPPPPPQYPQTSQPQYPQTGTYEPQYPQTGTYGHPISPQFQLEYGPPPPPVMPVPRRTNSLAIAALCCGVGQFVAGPIGSIPAIILGAMSLRQIRETGEDGHGMAVAGLVLGIVGTLLFVLAVAFMVAVATVVVHTGHTLPNPGGPGNFP
jgi:Domain of unknown function (DUF4190)